MADDNLRMSATVTDGFSGPLKALQAQLAAIGNNPVGRAINKDWQGVGASIEKATANLRSGFAPVVSAIGISSFGVAAGLTSATLALKTFAFSTRDLSIFSRQIGLSIGQLKEMKAIGERFGVDWGQAQGSLKTFASNIDQIQRRWGEAYGRLRAMNLGNLAEELVRAPDMKTAIDKALDAIKAIQNPVRRREVAELLFGSDQWATVASELTPKLRAEMKKMASEVTPEVQRAADEFVANWLKMEKAVERFTTKAVAPLLPMITELMNTLGKPVGEGLEKTLDRLTKAATLLNNGKWLEGLRVLDGASGPLARRLAPLPGDDLLNAEDRANEIRNRIKNADNAIRIIEGNGQDASRARARRDDLLDQLRRLTEEIEKLRKGGATVQQQSFFGGGGMGGLIQTAGFGGGGFGFRGSGGGFGGSGGAGGGSSGGGAPAPGAGTQTGVPQGVGGSRSWRNNNPGNIEYGPFARSMGATGSDGRFAIFPDYAAGRKAQEELLFNSKGYRGLTLAQAIGRWAPASDGNNVGAYANRLARAAGVGVNALMSDLSPEQRKQVLDAMQKHEGWRVGKRPGQDAGGGGGAVGGPGLINEVIKLAEEAGLHITSGYRSPGHPLSLRNPGSAHARGRAFDARAKTPDEADAAMAKIRSVMAGRGMVEGRDYKIRDEVRNPVGWATGPHVHTELTEAGAKRWGGGTRGDQMMARAYGGAGSFGTGAKLDATGTVNINLSGGLEKAPARVTMDGLFKNVRVNRRPEPADTGDASP